MGFEFSGGTERQLLRNSLAFGDGANGDKFIVANNGSNNKPALKFDDATQKWRYSNDGITWIDLNEPDLFAAAAIAAQTADLAKFAAQTAAITAGNQAEAATAQANLILNGGLPFLNADNLTITYNANGTVNTVSNGTVTKTIGYTNGVATSVT